MCCKNFLYSLTKAKNGPIVLSYGCDAYHRLFLRTQLT